MKVWNVFLIVCALLAPGGGAQAYTYFDELGVKYTESKPIKLEEMPFGWFTGRCFPRSNPNQAYGCLLAFTREDYGPDLARPVKFTVLCDPAWPTAFDSMTPERFERTERELSNLWDKVSVAIFERADNAWISFFRIHGNPDDADATRLKVSGGRYYARQSIRSRYVDYRGDAYAAADHRMCYFFRPVEKVQ